MSQDTRKSHEKPMTSVKVAALVFYFLAAVTATAGRILASAVVNEVEYLLRELAVMAFMNAESTKK